MKWTNLTSTIISACLTGACLISASLTAHADDLQFQQTQASRDYTKVSCVARHDVSKSQVSKHITRYQANLNPRDIKSLIRMEKRLNFEQFESKLRLYAYGYQAFSTVESNTLAISLKTSRGQSLSTIIFNWSERNPHSLRALARHNRNLYLVDMGKPRCDAKSMVDSVKTCEFSVDLEDQGEIEPLYIAMMERNNKYPNEELTIEVTYRTGAYLDCSGTRSFAVARDFSQAPVISLMKD